MAVLYVAAGFLGVRLSAREWLVMTLLILIGLIPFTVLGVLLGHMVTSDAIGPATGGLTALFAILGGSWGPLAQTGTLHRIAEALPSYWLAQAAKAATDHTDWPVQAWAVVAAWTVLLTIVATKAYQRDTARP